MSLHDSDYYKGLSSLFGGFLVHLTFGTFYTLGNVNTYLSSYLRKYVDNEADYTSAIWINASFMFGQGLVMIVGGILERKIGARLTVLIGSTIFSLAVMSTYYSIKRGFGLVVLSYGFLSSLGCGIGYIAPLSNSMKWFPRRKGLVSGITVAGFGLGALIFNQVQTMYLNPGNYPPSSSGYFEDEAILLRVPSLFVMLGAIYLVMQIIGALLIFSPPLLRNEIITSDGCLLISQIPDSVNNEGYSSCEDSSTGTEHSEHSNKEDLKLSEALRSSEFFKMWIMFALVSQGVQFMNTMYKAFGQLFIKSDHFLVFVGSMASLFNAGGRIFWGLILDATSFRKTFISMCSIICILMLTFILTQWAESKLLYFMWVCAIFFSCSGMFVIFPTATALVFGKSHAGAIYGLLFTAPAVISLVGAFLFQKIQKELDWFGSFFFIVVLTVIAMILTAFFPSDEKRRKS